MSCQLVRQLFTVYTKLVNHHALFSKPKGTTTNVASVSLTLYGLESINTSKNNATAQKTCQMLVSYSSQHKFVYFVCPWPCKGSACQLLSVKYNNTPLQQPRGKQTFLLFPRGTFLPFNYKKPINNEFKNHFDMIFESKKV